MRRCFPGSWQVHFIWPNGRGALLTGIEKARPSYERLLSVLQGVPGAKASRSWVDRVNPFSRVRIHDVPRHMHALSGLLAPCLTDSIQPHPLSLCNRATQSAAC